MAFRPKQKAAEPAKSSALPPLPPVIKGRGRPPKETQTEDDESQYDESQYEEEQTPTTKSELPSTKSSEEDKQVWTVSEIATETQPVIYNKITGETLDILGALVRILNIFEETEEQ